MITTARDPPHAPPTRLTFGLPEHNNRDAEAPTAPLANSNLGNDAGQAAADMMRNSLSLAEEGTALHASIKSALLLHDA